MDKENNFEVDLNQKTGVTDLGVVTYLLSISALGEVAEMTVAFNKNAEACTLEVKPEADGIHSLRPVSDGGNTIMIGMAYKNKGPGES